MAEVKAILQEESELNEIVRLVGFDALSEKDRLTLECARSIREDFLQQDSFREVDRYTSVNKQAEMLSAILAWYHGGLRALERGAPYRALATSAALGLISAMKYRPGGRVAAACRGAAENDGRRICRNGAGRRRKLRKEYKTIREVVGPLMLVECGGRRQI